MAKKIEGLSTEEAIAKMANEIDHIAEVLESLVQRVEQFEHHGPPEYGHYKGIEP